MARKTMQKAVHKCFPDVRVKFIVGKDAFDSIIYKVIFDNKETTTMEEKRFFELFDIC
jgi:hypothetical protein